MKKKNGFTLIELLAVIVILAVIALIAVPQILKILDKARLNAAKDSTYGIIKAAETYATNFMLENNGSLPNEDLVFNCSSYGCILENDLEDYNTENLDKLSFKGTKPTSGKITISDNGRIIKGEDLIINNFRCNYDKGASCGGIDEIPTPPTVLITPTAESNPSGYSQSKEVAINFTGDGTYLVMSTKDVTTNVEAITCRDVIDASFTCDGDVINTNGTLLANTWYKVNSKPTLTLEENGSIYYKVSDRTNYKDGGSITITEIDTTAPTVASVTQKSATTNSITVTASGTDNESNIVRYQFSIDGGEWQPSTPQEENEYTFNNVTSGDHQIKARVINGTYTNNGQNDNNTTESNSITMTPGELTKPTATSSPEGYSQSKTTTINFTGSGTYLIRPSVNVTTNVIATTCSSVNNGMFNCNGDNVLANETLIANTWYKVESNPILTFTNNGSVTYQVSDGINYKDGGSLTITEIDTTTPTSATFTTNIDSNYNMTVTASGADNESGISRYQFSIDDGEWQPSTPQTSNAYTFSDLKPGLTYNIKVRVINGTYENNGQNSLNTTESNSENIEIMARITYSFDPAQIVSPIITNNSFSISTINSSGDTPTYKLRLPSNGYSFNWSMGTPVGFVKFYKDNGEIDYISSTCSGSNVVCSGSYTITGPGYIGLNFKSGNKISINNLTYNANPLKIVFDYAIPSSSVSFKYGDSCTTYQGNFKDCTNSSENGAILNGNVYVIGGHSAYSRQISINDGEWKDMPVILGQCSYLLPGLGTYKIRTRTAINGLYSEPTEEYTVTVQ